MRNDGLPRQLSRIGMRFLFGMVGIAIMLGVFLIQNPDVRDHLPIIGKDTCEEVSAWDEEAKAHRPDYVLEISRLGSWESLTSDDYQGLIDMTDENLTWFEENPGPEDAIRARENYVTHLMAIREMLVLAQNGTYGSEAAFANELNAHNLLLNDPATDFVVECL